MYMYIYIYIYIYINRYIIDLHRPSANEIMPL